MMLRIQDLRRRSPTNDACLQYLFERRFPDVTCPKCKRANAYHRHPTKPCYTCVCGQHQIFPKKGTIFEDSPLTLVKWFYALLLLWQAQEGMSAKELERRVNVAYPTAWRIAHKVRSILPPPEERRRVRTLEGLLATFMEVPSPSSRHAGPQGGRTRGEERMWTGIRAAT